MIAYWLLAARLKTLPVSMAPIIFALVLSRSLETFNGIVAGLTVFTALLIQIGTNFANDYYDYCKGADTTDRVGPMRMSKHKIQPSLMKQAFQMMFIVAAISLIYLTYYGGWPIFLIGVSAIICGVLYTCGPYALAYIGGAEFIAFIFFGPISVLGTYYLQGFIWRMDLLYIGAAFGCISSALLVVNNTRDIATDKKVNKKTFSVRFGRLFSYLEYIFLLYCPIFLLNALHI